MSRRIKVRFLIKVHRADTVQLPVILTSFPPSQMFSIPDILTYLLAHLGTGQSCSHCFIFVLVFPICIFSKTCIFSSDTFFGQFSHLLWVFTKIAPCQWGLSWLNLQASPCVLGILHFFHGIYYFLNYYMTYLFVSSELSLSPSSRL